MKKLMLLAAITALTGISSHAVQANESINVQSEQEVQIDTAAESKELVEDRIQEKRDILEREEEIARGEADAQIQSFESETQKGVQATATTRIDMR